MTHPLNEADRILSSLSASVPLPPDCGTVINENFWNLLSLNKMTTCILCKGKSFTTIEGIPICRRHYDRYKSDLVLMPEEQPTLKAIREAWKRNVEGWLREDLDYG